jgi:putative FmdB family regulatory protein
MPTYDFQCNNCNNIFEKNLEMSKRDIIRPECPKCNGSSKRLVAAPHFILKGPGFYANDYGKQGKTRKELEKKEKLKSEE